MAKVVIGAEVKVEGLDKAGQSVGSFKKQLREAQAELVSMADKFGTASTEAANAAKKVAGLKDAIGDAKALAETFNPDKKFVALGGAIQGVVAGFSAFSGAMGLLGIESKETEKLLLQVQSAMALQQGLSGIAGAVDSFKMLGNTIVTKVVTAFSTLKGAMIATGIGALAVGVGLLIANFDKLKDALGFASKSQQAYNDTIQDYQAGAKTAIEKINNVKNAFELAREGVISKKDALNTYNTTLGDTLGKAASLQEAEELTNKKASVYIQIMGLKAQANALFAKSADEAAKGIVASNEDQTSAFDKLKSGVLNFFGAGTAGITTLVNAQVAGIKTAQETANKNAELLNQEGLKLGAQAETLAKENQIKLTETTKGITKKSNDDSLKQLKEFIENKKMAMLTGHEKEYTELVKQYENAYKLAKNNYALTLELDLLFFKEREILRKKYAEKPEPIKRVTGQEKPEIVQRVNPVIQQEMATGDQRVATFQEKNQAYLDAAMAFGDVLSMITDARLQRELEKLGNNEQAKAELRQRYADDQNFKEQQWAAYRVKMAEAEKDGKIDAFEAVTLALTAASAIAGKQSAVGKALAIAVTTINTIQAAIGAFKGMVSTIPGPVGIALGAVAAAGVVASGVKAVKQITAVKIPGASGGGGAPSISLPNAPVQPQAQTTNLSQQSINAVGNAANRNYVLETDVSNNQERIRRLNRAARIN